MKCIFVATPYLFAVHYHAFAYVASRVRTGWMMSLDGLPESYRMQCGRDAQGRLDLACAVFVPGNLRAAAARRLLAGFGLAHPGVLPANLTFDAAGRTGTLLSHNRRAALPAGIGRGETVAGRGSLPVPTRLLRRFRRLTASLLRAPPADRWMPTA